MKKIIGKYVEDFKGFEECLVISAGSLASTSEAGLRIEYVPDDGSDVFVATEPSGDDGKVGLNADHDAIIRMRDMAKNLLSEERGGHHVIDDFSMPVIISNGEYDWLAPA